MPTWANWHSIKKAAVGYRPTPRQRTRAAFTMEEMNSLFSSVQGDAFSTALLRFFLHTGCRREAAVELRVNDVWDKVAGRCRSEGSVLEKFGDKRTLVIDSILSQALEQWIKSSDVKEYVFPCRQRTQETKLGAGGIGAWFRGVCAKAGVTGDHCFVHDIRRTHVPLLVRGRQQN
jgi:integrase